MTRRNALIKHQFVPWPGHRSYGTRICAACYGLETDSVHRVPELTEEQREHEQRKVGERESTQDTGTR